MDENIVTTGEAKMEWSGEWKAQLGRGVMRRRSGELQKLLGRIDVGDARVRSVVGAVSGSSALLRGQKFVTLTCA